MKLVHVLDFYSVYVSRFFSIAFYNLLYFLRYKFFFGCKKKLKSIIITAHIAPWTRNKIELGELNKDPWRNLPPFK